MTGNLEYYKVFYYVAEHKSLTLAAEALSISQPAVSQSMKLLEEYLGTKLFARTSRGVRLTPEGKRLYEYIKPGYEKIEQGEQVLKRLLNLEAGELHVGASDMTLQYYLLPYLEKYHELYPQIKVGITNGPTPETLQAIEAGKVDIALVSTPFDKRPGIEVIPVREIEDIYVAGNKYSELQGKPLEFADVSKYPVISLEKNTSTRRYMDEFLAEDGVMLNPEFELATSDMIVQFAVRNLGIGCVVKDFAKEDIEAGRLFALDFKKKIPKRQICIVINQKVPMSVATKELLNLLRKEL